MSVTQPKYFPYAVGLGITGIIFLVTRFAPEAWQGAIVGALFLRATWVFVWRENDEIVEEHGLALGGAILPGPLDRDRLFRSIRNALFWAALACAITFVPYFMGWHFYFRPAQPFHLSLSWKELGNEVLGQFLLVALPEEAFYRGYLQTSLERGTKKWNVFGAQIGIGLLASSAIFALGHLSPKYGPERLLVFFPALLFGWLRARTGGIGAGLTFHALCNLLSKILAKGFLLG